MNYTKMRLNIIHLLVLVLAFVLLHSYNLYSETFLVEGRINIINARANFTQIIQPTGSYNEISVYIHHFDNFTNGINKQIISPYKLSIYPDPAEQTKFIDQFGNSVTKITFKEKVPLIKIESNFIFSAQADVYSLETHYPFPVEDFDIRHQKEYLTQATYCPLNKPVLKKLAENIAKNLEKEYLVVLNTMRWVTDNIELLPDSTNKDAFTTYKNKYGNHDAIINLIVTLLRQNNIPARVVQGLAIDNNYSVKNSRQNIEARYPKCMYKWIEVYFPDRDWVPFDPFYSYFFITTNLIRRSVGKYSDDTLDYAFINGKKKLNIKNQFFVEVRRDANYFNVLDEFQEGRALILMPNLYYDDYDIVSGMLLQKYNTINSFHDKNGAISLMPYGLDFDLDDRRCEVKVSQDVIYAQSFTLKENYQLEQISLPIFRFNNDPFGKIWLTIFSDKAGKPDKEVGKSVPLSLETMQVEDKFFWCKFSFTADNKKHINLPKGKYWIIFNYDCDEVILWYGIFGNPIGGIWDTLFITTQTYRWENAAYLDLCFTLKGRYK